MTLEETEEALGLYLLGINRFHLLVRCSGGHREVSGEHEEKTEGMSSLPGQSSGPGAKGQMLTSDKGDEAVHTLGGSGLNQKKRNNFNILHRIHRDCTQTRPRRHNDVAKLLLKVKT